MTPEELEEHVKHIVDQAPPLTEAQRDRLRQLLAPPWPYPDWTDS